MRRKWRWIFGILVTAVIILFPENRIYAADSGVEITDVSFSGNMYRFLQGDQLLTTIGESLRAEVTYKEDGIEKTQTARYSKEAGSDWERLLGGYMGYDEISRSWYLQIGERRYDCPYRDLDCTGDEEFGVFLEPPVYRTDTELLSFPQSVYVSNDEIICCRCDQKLTGLYEIQHKITNGNMKMAVSVAGGLNADTGEPDSPADNISVDGKRIVLDREPLYCFIYCYDGENGAEAELCASKNMDLYGSVYAGDEGPKEFQVRYSDSQIRCTSADEGYYRICYDYKAGTDSFGLESRNQNMQYGSVYSGEIDLDYEYHKTPPFYWNAGQSEWFTLNKWESMDAQSVAAVEMWMEKIDEADILIENLHVENDKLLDERLEDGTVSIVYEQNLSPADIVSDMNWMSFQYRVKGDERVFGNVSRQFSKLFGENASGTVLEYEAGVDNRIVMRLFDVSGEAVDFSNTGVFQEGGVYRLVISAMKGETETQRQEVAIMVGGRGIYSIDRLKLTYEGERASQTGGTITYRESTEPDWTQDLALYTSVLAEVKNSETGEAGPDSVYMLREAADGRLQAADWREGITVSLLSSSASGESYILTGEDLRLPAGDYLLTAQTDSGLKEELTVKVLPSAAEVCRHQYGAWKVNRAATALNTGSRSRSCKLCGKKQTQVLKKLKAVIKLNTNNITLKIKQSTTAVKVTSMTKGDKTASWKSSNPKVAAVTSKGKITGKKSGTAKITVTLKSGVKSVVNVKVQKGTVATTKLTVTGKPVKITKNKLTLKRGKSETLTAVRAPLTSQQKVTYATSDKKVATVSRSGKITAKKAGKAKITVTSGKRKVVITVTVKK